MILKRLVIEGYGPFALPATLDVDQNVTILTGQNDVGKSAVLRLIQRICQREAILEDDYNVDRTVDAGTTWDRDADVKCIATFVTSEYLQHYTPSNNLVAGDEIDIEFLLTLNRAQCVTARRGVVNFSHHVPNISHMPNVLWLPTELEVNSIIDTTSLNSLEQSILLTAFGPEGVSKLAAHNDVRRRRELRSGNDRLNEELSKLLPFSMGLKLVLDVLEVNPYKFSLGFEDQHGGDTPVNLRGSGVRKMLTLIALLLDKRISESRHHYILFDEPENSLHADAQHRLRSLLEALAMNKSIQVIYATHSPSMINTVNCSGLRLLRRTNINGKATTEIDNQPIKDNFLPIRTSLGLSPSDSLLYAPITIVVEGDTEIATIATLLQRLSKESIQGFEQAIHLLSQSHFINGQGDSFEYWCRLAKSQGSKVIIFVDGDKIRRVKQQDVSGKHPDVPIITLKEGQELEDLIPRECYFQALSEITGEAQAQELFEIWHERTVLPPKMMFSKRVERWLQDGLPDFTYYKAVVMKRALEMTETSQIDLNPMRQLVEVMRTSLKSE
ncbi:MAG: ATP-binding protein [Anaerolineae bacterium]|nr:ATP-binding protein [Anaerolineae bacterium]